MLRSTAIGDIVLIKEKNVAKVKRSTNKDYDVSVEELNIPEATVHCRIVGIYTRDISMKLNFVDGRFGNVVQDHWGLFTKNVDEHLTSDSEHGVTVRYISIDKHDTSLPAAIINIFDRIKETNVATHDSYRFRIAEIKAPGEDQYRGVIMVDGPLSDFDEWFEALVLSESQLSKASLPVSNTPEVESVVNKLTNIFDKEFRNVTHDDMWELGGGREYFADRVRFFVSRNTKIEACLPAFPCKSSNTMKVAGNRPDKGEELALRRIIAFSKMVQKIYTPGIKVWIVSDGHVFSDCIGVDDSVVDRYGLQLKQLYDQITKETTIGFRALPELFTSRLGKFKPEYTKNVVLPHFLNTEIKADAEICRAILMCGCSTDPEILRSMIDCNDPAKIALYRGFSKFMFEDLAQQPATVSLGSKSRRKLASKVAFEMIKRNEAYSNLVGLLLPYHLRLSIHAHNNSGPKFGIRLLSHDKARTVKSLTLEELQSSDDLLHIPTPWHNCVVEIEGKDCYYVVKSAVVKSAIESHQFTGEWVDGSYGEGGKFKLKPVEEMPVTAADSDSELSEKFDAMSFNNTESSSSSFSNDTMKNPMIYGIIVDPALRIADALQFADSISLIQEHHNGIEIYAISTTSQQANGVSQILTQSHNATSITINECPQLDVLFVPSLKNLDSTISCDLCKFISDKYEEVEHIISSGTGSLALSKSGVLDGCEASVSESRKLVATRSFENVNWVSKPWTYSNKIWTSSHPSGSSEAMLNYVREAYGENTSYYFAQGMGY